MLTNFSAIFAGAYEGSDVGSSAENGIYYLSNFFAMLVSFYCIYVITCNKQRMWYFYAGFLLTCIWMTILLYSGDRNFFFLVAMVFFAGYFTFKKSLNYAVLVVVLFSAFSLYSVVEVLRKLDNKDIFIAVEETLEARDDSFLETSSITNTTITARAAIDYTNSGESIYYGKFKIIGFAGIIPFSRSLFVAQNDYETTSSQVLTSYILGPNANWSTGTNVVSDIYLDFGVIGVFLLMYLYGRFAKFIQIHVTLSPTFENMCCYLMLLSLTSQLPRYAFDFPVRYFIWLVAVLYFFSLVNKKIRRS
jgi:oligosaccharide repeat unit polymerase